MGWLNFVEEYRRNRYRHTRVVVPLALILDIVIFFHIFISFILLLNTKRSFSYPQPFKKYFNIVNIMQVAKDQRKQFLPSSSTKD